MANIGVHPSISKLDQAILEVNLFNFNEDIYDEVIEVEFLYFLREEVKFSSIDGLINQLKKDKDEIIKREGK